MPRADSRGRRTVLIADPDTGIRRQLVRSLSERLAGEAAVDALTCENLDSALSILRSSRVDVALIEQGLFRAGGARLAEALAELEVVITTPSSEATSVTDAPAFVRAFVERSKAAPDASVFAIVRALDVALLKEQGRRADLSFSRTEGSAEIVTASKTMRAIALRARRVAPTPSPVLIIGEPGTGKELLARYVYRTSQRGALVSIDASELPAEGLDQELEAGAVREGAGPSAWARADDGTLLVLHVERLSRSAQSAMLARLSSATRRVRVLATADAELLELVRAGGFDRDLFLVLGQPLLELPALRQRREDIPVLANHFLLQFLHAHPGASRELRVGVEAMRVLRGAPLPGNVAELEAAMTYAALVARTSTIVPGDLPDREGAQRALRTSLGEEPYAQARQRVLADFEREYVEEVLARTARNIAQAAREAGMDRANFRRLMKRAQGTKKATRSPRPSASAIAPVPRRKKGGAGIRPDEPDRGES